MNKSATLLLAAIPLSMGGLFGTGIASCGDAEDVSVANAPAGSSGTGSGGASAAQGSGGAPSGSGGAGGAASGATSGSGPGPTPTEKVLCEHQYYECGDLVDNDEDGLLDSQDPDCLGPCDNTEGGLYGGIPGQAGPPCIVDCYFDQDSGAGNDHCHWNHRCDPHETAPDYHPESILGAQCEYDENANTPDTPDSCAELYAAQSDECLSFCGPLTPNGCDCFGCCELPAGSGKYVWLGSEDADGNGTCFLDSVGQPDKCQPCLPVQGCMNPCDTCELCIGKSVLPPECFPDGGSGSGSGGGGLVGQCPAGVQACGLEGEALCPVDYYCVTGCCQKVPS